MHSLRHSEVFTEIRVETQRSPGTCFCSRTNWEILKSSSPLPQTPPLHFVHLMPFQCAEWSCSKILIKQDLFSEKAHCKFTSIRSSGQCFLLQCIYLALKTSRAKSNPWLIIQPADTVSTLVYWQEAGRVWCCGKTETRHQLNQYS